MRINGKHTKKIMILSAIRKTSPVRPFTEPYNNQRNMTVMLNSHVVSAAKRSIGQTAALPKIYRTFGDKIEHYNH